MFFMTWSIDRYISRLVIDSYNGHFGWCLASSLDQCFSTQTSKGAFKISKNNLVKIFLSGC